MGMLVGVPCWVAAFVATADGSSGDCSFHRVDMAHLGTDEAEVILSETNRPLLLTGLEPKRWRAAVDRWGGVRGFVDRYKSHRIGLGLARQNDFMSVGEYFEESNTEYVGCSQLFGAREITPLWFDTLKDDFPPSEGPVALAHRWARPIASVGAPATGSVAHQHDASWFLLLHGAKHWIVADGANDWGSVIDECPCKWHFNSTSVRDLPGAKHCVQHPGEVVYLPDNWWHATCNIEEDSFCTGIGSQGSTVDWPRLALAVLADDASVVRAAAKFPSILDGDVPEGGGAALHLAALQGRREAIAELLRLRADTERRCKAYRTPLLTAASKGHAAGIELLLQHRADASARGDEGRAATHWAAGLGSVEALELLAGAESALLTAEDPGGAQPIHMAAVNGHVSALSWLLKENADVNARDLLGRTPLGYVLELEQVRRDALTAARAPPDEDANHLEPKAEFEDGECETSSSCLIEQKITQGHDK